MPDIQLHLENEAHVHVHLYQELKCPAIQLCKEVLFSQSTLEQ